MRWLGKYVWAWAAWALVGLSAAACQSPASESVPAVSELEIPPIFPIADPALELSKPEEPARTSILIQRAEPGRTDSNPITVYETSPQDPILKALSDDAKKAIKDRENQTTEIRDRMKKEREAKKQRRLQLLSELPPNERPNSLEPFQIIPHLPPVPQYLTGTCWSFSGTSLMESETIRVTGKKIKLSEMHTVYYEYLAKGARFVEERGNLAFGQGSQAESVLRVFREFGAMPHEAYPGIPTPDTKHSHRALFADLKALNANNEQSKRWDGSTHRGFFEVVLKRELGSLPPTVTFEGRALSPKAFLKDVLKLNPDHYVSFMSTMKTPFYKQGVFDMPDNWDRYDGYHNLPLDAYYQTLKGAVTSGYSVVVAIDVGEPGYHAASDTMFVPPYDIPADRIDQLSRELRVNNRASTDDHAVHVVGHARIGDWDWFLAKDSGASSRSGRFEGYYMIRDDYIRLKVLSFMVHRDGVKEALSKF